jgi:hypothetical protein
MAQKFRSTNVGTSKFITSDGFSMNTLGNFFSQAQTNFFRIHETSQEQYLYSEFEPWATLEHPKVFLYIGEYENPFPQMIGVEMTLAEKDLNKAPESNSGFIKVTFVILYGPMLSHNVPKKFAKNTDLLYIRSWAGQTFKIKDMANVQLSFKNPKSDCFELMDEDNTKGLDYYGVTNDAEILLEEKQNAKKEW